MLSSHQKRQVQSTNALENFSFPARVAGIGLLAGVLAVVAGCEKKEPSQRGDEPTPVVRPTTETADHQGPAVVPTDIQMGYKHKVGEVLVYRSCTETLEGTAQSPLILEFESKDEVVEVSGEEVKWKIVESERVKSWGDHYPDERAETGAGYSNRLSFETRSVTGELLATEGAEPDAESSYRVYPSGPIKVGDSWKGYTIVEGKKYSDSYELKQVFFFDGRVVALIESTHQRAYKMEIFGRTWVDSNQIILKGEWAFRGFDQFGNSGRGKAVSHLIDEKGQPVFP